MDISLSVASGGPSVVGSVLRSNQAYLELTSDKHTLDWGIAFYSQRYPRLHSINQLREAWLENDADVHRAIAEVSAFFNEVDAVCAGWTIAEAQPPEHLASALEAAGYERETFAALALPAWPEKAEAQNVRVLPARPMRDAYERVSRKAAQLYDPDQEDDYADAAFDLLDDHRIDMYVAMVDQQPAGRGALFQVGDIGRIVDLYVVPEFRHRGVARALLSQIAEVARRGAVRVVCGEVTTRNVAGLEAAKALGFVKTGESLFFRHPKAPVLDYANW